MKKLFLTVTLCLAALGAWADSGLTIKDITGGAYSPQYVYGVRPMNDGETYTQLEDGGRKIVRRSFKTGKAVSTLFDVATARGQKLERIDGYILSPDESRILIQTATKPIYRHSFTAVYYLYSVANNRMEPLSDGGPQQSPVFSPDGNLVAFVRDNNIFLVKLLFGNSESQVTKDGERNAILNGIPDWVNEEEFSTARSLEFNADNTMLAWVRYDERKVPVYSMTEYKGLAPEHKEHEEYPGEYEYKYPVAGATNSKVSVMTFDIKNRVTRTMKLPIDSTGYVPRIKFTADPNRLAVVTLNRTQNDMRIYMANPRSTECRLSLQETSDKYVKESAYTDLHFYGDHFAMISDRSGYRHIYWYTLGGQLTKQVTSGDYEVTDFYGYDEKTGRFYYAANPDGPQYKAVYSTDLKGKTKRLTEKKGTNDATFSRSMKYFMNVFSDHDTPPVTTLCDNSGRTLATLVDNKALSQKLAGKTGTKEFFTFTTSEGVQLNGWMVKPADFDPNKKYAVVLYQYSGPGSQEVRDAWNMGFMPGALFESYMAERGVLFACVDGRGTGGRGADFEKCTYLRLGDLESKDQVEAALYLSTLPYIDKNRIGIWGWSFGGFNTLMSMSEGRPVFRAGVAVAAPSNWKYYDTVYTERYMRTPQENASGYAINPINRAKDLHGALLLIHGTADDNVHYRNATEYSEALVQADKQFDMQVYTNRNHNIFGGNTRNHLFTRIANFFLEELGE